MQNPYRCAGSTKILKISKRYTVYHAHISFRCLTHPLNPSNLLGTQQKSSSVGHRSCTNYLYSDLQLYRIIPSKQKERILTSMYTLIYRFSSITYQTSLASVVVLQINSQFKSRCTYRRYDIGQREMKNLVVPSTHCNIRRGE